MNPFEVYEPERSTSAGRGVPVVYVLSGGRLILNAAAVRLLGDSTSVQLLWDATTKKVGIKPTSDDDPKGFRVSRAPSQATITSKGFVEKHELPYKTRMRVARDGDTLVASVTNPGDPLG